MVGWILKKIVGSKNQRELRRLAPTVRRINEFDEQFKSLSDDALRAKTAAWKDELAKTSDPEEQWRRLDEILPEAFAAVKNAARRLKERRHSFTVCDQPMTWDMVHFDVQLVGGMVLHRGRIAEMATGEGKTLVATLSLYLNALTGRGAHLVTVNDHQRPGHDLDPSVRQMETADRAIGAQTNDALQSRGERGGGEI